jgi:hypothetical protein
MTCVIAVHLDEKSSRAELDKLRQIFSELPVADDVKKALANLCAGFDLAFTNKGEPLPGKFGLTAQIPETDVAALKVILHDYMTETAYGKGTVVEFHVGRLVSKDDGTQRVVCGFGTEI